MSKRWRVQSKMAIAARRRGSPAPGGLGHGRGERSGLEGTAIAEAHSQDLQFGGSGLGHALSVRLLVCVSFCFWGFSRSTEVRSTRFLNRCGAIFDTDATVLVL